MMMFSGDIDPKRGLDQFLETLLLSDNIPIVGMLIPMFFFTYLGFREARKNDQLTKRRAYKPPRRGRVAAVPARSSG